MPAAVKRYYTTWHATSSALPSPTTAWKPSTSTALDSNIATTKPVRFGMCRCRAWSSPADFSSTSCLVALSKSATMDSSVIPAANNMTVRGNCSLACPCPIAPPLSHHQTIPRLWLRHFAVPIVMPANSSSSKLCRRAAVILHDDHDSNCLPPDATPSASLDSCLYLPNRPIHNSFFQPFRPCRPAFC